MEGFWKWLSRANARNVLIGALVALIAVCGAWVWTEVTYHATSLRSARSPGAAEARPRLGILDFISAQLAQNASVAANRNPFLPPTPPPEAAPPKNVEPPPAPAARVAPAPAGPVRAGVSLTYRGLFRLPDGQTLAMIEDSRSKRAAFYHSGDRVLGVTLEHADMTLAVVRAAGATQTLPFGRACAIEE